MMSTQLQPAHTATALATVTQHPITVYDKETEESITHYVTLDPEKLAGTLAPSTKAVYRRDVEAYERFARANGKDALQPQTLAEWRAQLANAGYSPNTINRMLSSVRAVAKGAVEYISADLALRIAAVKGVKVSAMRDQLKKDARTKITPADMRRLCEAPDTSTPAGMMHHALLLTMATSGLRIAEVVTLTMAQIHRRDGGYIVTVTGKGRSEEREAPLGKEAYAAIERWLAARPVASGWIFTGFGGRGSRDPRTNHIHPVSAWELVKRYAGKVGLSGVKPHDFRRFVGTNLAKTDLRQAQRALGHKDINTTAKHYVLDELTPGLTDGLF